MFAAIAAAGMLFAMGGQAEQGNGKPKHLTMYVGYVEKQPVFTSILYA